MSQRLVYYCFFAGLLLTQSALAQTGKDDIYFDALTSTFYKQDAQGNLQRVKGTPMIKQGRSVALHVLNVNIYRKRIVIGSKAVSLFQDQPAGFSLASMLVKVAPPTAVKSLQSFGLGAKGTVAQQDLDSLRTKIADFNAQCTAFKEISNLDGSLKSMAAYGEEPVIDPMSTDPRKPGLDASQRMASKFKEYINKLFADSAAPNKSTAENAGPQDFKSLADAKEATIKSTFSDIQQAYFSVKQQIQPALTPLVPAPTKSTQPTASAPVVNQAPPALTDLSKQLDQAFSQAQQNVNALDLDATTREARLQTATAVYNQLTTQNIYQFDGPTTLSRSDEIIYTIQVFDANTPPPSATALTVMGQSPSTTIETPVPVEPATKSTGGGKTAKTKPKAPTPAKPPSLFPAGGSPNPPGSSNSGTQQAEQTIEVPILVTGKIKSDFSTGFFISNLTNANYIAAGSASPYTIRKGSSDQFAPSIGGLMHFYVTSESNIVPAISLGVAQGLDSSGTQQFFFGGSLISGRDQRFILSFGLAAAPVQRLDGYSVNGSITSTTVPTRQIWRTGLFLGLTYNMK